MSVTLNLFRLQQLDTRLDQVNARLNAIQTALENNAELQAAQKAQAAAEADLLKAEKALKHAEDESARQRIKLEQADSSLYSGHIHNPKELQDLQNDVAALKRQLATLEDAQLEAMLAIEEARSRFEAACTALTSTQGRVISQNSSLQSEHDDLLREAERLASQRNAVLPIIAPASLARYTSLRQEKRGNAVTTISDNTCDTCGALLTPGHAQAVRFSTEIVTCPSCGRILFSN
jgi:predicted  nucleic acid-binding Zn-ribbon protein